jgi:hypothetical protein
MSASKDHIEAIWPIVNAAIEALLRAQPSLRANAEGSMEAWLKKLDYLYGSIFANKALPAHEFKENGLIPPPTD